MPRTTPTLLPRMARLLAQIGSNLKLARLRRKFSAATVAQRAGISRKTLYRVEQGDPGVSLGTYARVLQVLRLEKDLAVIGADDKLGRKLLDAGLIAKRRASRLATSAPMPIGNIEAINETLNSMGLNAPLECASNSR